jgi:hypothetical protein
MAIRKKFYTLAYTQTKIIECVIPLGQTPIVHINLNDHIGW